MRRFLFIVIALLSLSSAAYPYSLFSYFSDKKGPVIASEFSSSISHRGKIKIPFLIEDEDTSVKEVQVYVDKNDVTSFVDFGSGYKNNKLSIDSEQLKDGIHYITIIAEDSSKAKNISVQEIPVNIDNTPPVLKLASGGGTFRQGKTGIIYFRSSEPLAGIDGVFQSKDIKAYPYKDKYRAILGFSIDDPGNKNYYMKIKAKDLAGNLSEYHYRVYVSAEKYGTLSFTLKPKKMEMLMPDVIREDWKKIEDVVKDENPKKYWQGRFEMPTSGRISMTFGIDEFINGDESGKHRGLDIANAAGTLVKAANSGIVRLAERLPAHGNCVVIEHGQGIFTYYAHMQKLLVGVSEKVMKGQIIGQMGKTGVATGPHLHFSVSLHNLRVDPMQWLNGMVLD